MNNYWLGLIGFLLLAGCKEIAEINDMKVTGQVLDISCKAPLDSAVVDLYEDNDGPFMGKHLLQSYTTGPSGNFNFNFTYKEGPYIIYVYRKGYVYQRLVKNTVLNQEMIFDYQNVEGLKNEQHIVLEMQPVALLSFQVKNVAPALSTDLIRLEIGKGLNNQPLFTRTYDGLTDTDFQIGSVPANQYVPIKYEVRENGIWRSVQDSVMLQRGQNFTFRLDY